MLVSIAGCGGSGPTAGPGGVLPEGDPTSLHIEPGAPAFAPGTSRQLVAMAAYGNGASADVTASVTWTSSDDAALSIQNGAGSKGQANRHTDASAEIEATLGALSASWNVTVWSTVLATGLHLDGDVGGTGTGYGVGRLVEDASGVSWAAYDASAGGAGGSIGRVAKSGGAMATLASGLGGINAVASDGTYVYWTEYVLATAAGAVKRVPVGGGVVEVLATGTPAGSVYDVFFPGGIALDADFVYWGEHVGGGAVRRVAKSGGGVTDLGRGAGFGPTALAIQDGFLYGVDNTSGMAARLPVGGGSVEVLASGLANPSDIALDAQALYTAELVGDTGRIVRVPLAGGAVTTVSSDLDNPRSVDVIGGRVYYPGVVRSGVTPLMGVWTATGAGGAEEFAVNASGTLGGFDPYSLAVDAGFIYFLDAAWNVPGGARLLRAPRE